MHDTATTNESTRLFALVACQRTGTQLLKEILNSNANIALLGEPFTPNPQPAYWHNFLRQLPANEYPPLLVGNALAIADRYMEVLRRDVDEDSAAYGGPKPQLQALGLDVKYNQLRSITPIFNDLLSPPFLIEYFRARQIPIVHLVRKNLAHTAISMIIANMRKVWHNDDGVQLDGTYRICPYELLGYMMWVKQERNEFLRFANDLSILTVTYEDLVGDLACVGVDAQFPDNTLALSRIASFLNTTNTFRLPAHRHRVINRPYAEVIENCGELIAMLADSEFAEFAETLCPPTKLQAAA